ncbi:hypothetical protein [Rhodovulum steppense]|uniref:hypothetical protein n=1 Tax=Rhodovulum steppense TaxID=540251 RepID=UPI001404393C|nr:hypothetical protein [Rhodovulum steppense]
MSYGTFSCTLEGFEDSFGTMKAIAEYFRDLAADDRFFGAEPPSPDARMLQSIVEREIRKRVEARVDEDGIVLRPAPRTGAGIAPDVPPVFAEAMSRTAVPTAQDSLPPHGARPSDEPETVAAKLARIRAVVESARTAAPAEYSAPFLDTASDAPAPLRKEGHPAPKSPDPTAEASGLPLAGPTDESRVGTDKDTALASDPIPVKAPESPSADATGHADMNEPALGSRVAARAPTRPDHPPAPDSVAAPVVAQGIETVPPRARARVLKLKRETVAAHWPEAPRPAAAPPSPERDRRLDEPRLADAAEAELQAKLAAIWTEFAAVGSLQDPGTAPAPETPTRALTDDMPRMPQDDRSSETAGAAPCGPVEPDAPEDMAPGAARPDDSAMQHAPPAEQGPLVLDSPLGFEDRLSAETTPAQAEPGNAIAMRIDTDAHPDDQSDDPVDSPSPAQVETAVQRIWDETNTKLDGIEQTRRHSSIAHLKAAVAATFADIRSGTARTAGSEDEHARRPYRQVLAKVVRGDRSDSSDAPTGQHRHLAPLMLVSEQRVDIPQSLPGEARMALRPRGMTARDAADAPESALPDGNAAGTLGFTRYLADHGTTGIAGVIEAAATYLQTERGHERFTRPEVLRLSLDHSEADISRGEALRAFAGLLRIGTFRKVGRGAFVLAARAPEGDTPEAERRHA